MKEPDVLGHESNADRESGGHRGPRETLLGLLFIAWSGFVVWHYASTVLKVRSVPEFLGLTLLATVLVVGVPGALLARLERRCGRRVALMALLTLGGVPAAYLVAASGVAVAAAATLFLLAAACGYGAAVARLFGIGDDLRDWQGAPLTVALGLAVLTVLGIALGVAGWLSKSVVLAVLALGVVLAALVGRRLLAPSGAAPSALPVAALSWWWGLIVVMLVGLVGAVAPEVRHDALAAHLPIAREFVIHGAIVNMPQNIQSYFPLNAHVLYAIGMVLVSGEAVPKLITFAAGVFACLLTFDLGARLWRPQVGVAAALVVASTPLVLRVGGTAYADLVSVLFVTGAIACLVLLAGGPNASRAAAVGMMVGAAAGTKLVSLVAGIPALVAACLLIVWGAPGRDRAWRALAALALGAALTGAFWYGRAWVLTGNPVFPLMNAVFKSPHWAIENTRFNMDLFGTGTGLADLLAMPWRVTFFPGRFVEDGNLGPVYLVLLPAVLLAVVRVRTPRWLLGISGAAVLLWFFGAQYLRYLLPVIPVLAVIGAAGLMAGSTPARTLGAAGGALVLSISVAVAGWMSSGSANFPLGTAVGKVPKAEHASAHVGGFMVAEYARRTLPADARIYGAGEDFSFYYDRAFVPISWYGRLFDRTLPDRVLGVKTGRDMQQVLSQAGFSHMVLYRDYPMIARWRRPDGWIAREAFWEEGPRLEFAYREYYLFDLSPAPGAGSRVRGEDLLQNGGMSGKVGAAPAGWDRHGAVGLVSAGPGSAGAHVRIGPGGHIVQRLAVTPHRLYVLETEVRAVLQSASARLFIQWFDEGGRVLDYATWRRVTVGPDWKRYAMACTAPRTARSAQVWLIADEGSEVEFGKAHFYVLR